MHLSSRVVILNWCGRRLNLLSSWFETTSLCTSISRSWLGGRSGTVVGDGARIFDLFQRIFIILSER